MSGVSRSTSLAGCRPLESSRHTSRSALPLASGPRSIASCTLCHGASAKPGKRAARSVRAASPCGRLATGCRVRAASGTERLISAATSVLVIRLLPVLVPPQTAATSTGSRDTCGRSLPKSEPYQSSACGSGAPSERASGCRASIRPHSSSTLPAHAANPVRGKDAISLHFGWKTFRLLCPVCLPAPFAANPAGGPRATSPAAFPRTDHPRPCLNAVPCSPVSSR